MSLCCNELDNNLHHRDTCFYKLENKIVDVDYLKDFDDFKKVNVFDDLRKDHNDG